MRELKSRIMQVTLSKLQGVSQISKSQQHRTTNMDRWF